MKLFKKIGCALLSFSMLFTAVACGGNSEPPEEVNLDKGYYVMKSLNVNNMDIKNSYSYYYIRVKDGENLEIKNCTISGVSTENCTYTTADADKVKIKIGRREYTYIYDADTKTLNFDGKNKNGQDEISTFKYEPTFSVGSSQRGVSFTKKGQKLFADDETNDKNGVYNYCPSIIYEGNNMHVYFCSDENNAENVPLFIDYIAYRKGTLQPNGEWVFGEKQLVVKPGRKNGSTDTNDWDYVQCCDPSVIKGEFNYNSEKYFYLMAYLGSKNYTAMENEVGLAVAKNPEGPWVKVNEGSDTAFIDFYHDEHYGVGQWGIGQPCLINADGKSKVLLFYSYDGETISTNTAVEYYDFSNLNNIVKIKGRKVMGSNGIYNPDKQDSAHNADFCYDPSQNRLYCITDEFYMMNDTNPKGITGTSSIYYIQLDNTDTFPCETLFNRVDYNWNHLQRLSKDTIGWTSAQDAPEKVHNTGLVTNPYGHMLFTNKLYAAYTISINAGINTKESLESYRLYGYELNI